MYDLNVATLGKNLKHYRKLRDFTLDELGEKIHKSKATISKYEKNEIIPDIITVLELCNSLNINLSQLFPFSTSNLNSNPVTVNPFHSDKVYLYYYTENKLIMSVLELQTEENSILTKLYNGVKNINHYKTDSCYYYEGTLKSDKIIGYINLVNPSYTENLLENIQISFSIPWSKKFQITSFFILGLTPNSLPVVKKGIMSTFPIKNLTPYKNDLHITKSDISSLQKDNCWILSNKNYDISYIL